MDDQENIEKVKTEVVRIKKIVDKLYERLFIPAPVVMEVVPEVQVENI